MPDGETRRVHTFVIPEDRMAHFRERLSTEGFSFAATPPNAFMLWRASRDGVIIDSYRTGKVVIQGGDAAALLARADWWPDIIGPEADGDLIGIDEAGKGDYFGPLVVAAVLVRDDRWKDLALIGTRDSKSLSDERIARLSTDIRKAYPHSIVAISPARYNQMYARIRNLNRLLAWGHARALENILSHWECATAISDQFGDASYLQSALMEKGKRIHLVQRPKAEENLAVAAASILARGEFVRRLATLGEQYGMILPKGAGPRVLEAGREFIRRHGSAALPQVAKVHFRTTREIGASPVA